jgi:4-amino-4-deoxy-L-arabinose transferase-like glycosyltransferase
MSVLAVFAVGVWLSVWNIQGANESVDEGIYAQSGWEYLHGNFTANLEHPPTAKYLYGFAQMLGGQGLHSARLLAATMAVGVGVVIWLWLRPEVGWLSALMPVAVWFLVPRTLLNWTDRVDRYVMLEPVMAFFGVVAFAAAWAWFRTRSTWWAAASGVAFGLAVTSKLTAVAMLPALLTLACVGALRAAVWFSASMVATIIAVYAPAGPSAIRYMVEFQSEHNDSGHLVAVGSYIGEYPPWWANLWYMVTAIGIPGMVVLVAGSVSAFLLFQPRRLVALLGAAIVGPLVLHLLVMNVALSQYWYAWLWPTATLSGLGVVVLLQHPGRLRWVGAALIVTLAVAGGQSVLQVAGQRPSGMALVDQARLDDPGMDRVILVSGGAPWDWAPFLRDPPATLVEQVEEFDVTAIVVKRSRSRPPDPRVLELVEDHGRRIDLDGVELYLFDEPLALEDGRLTAPE